MKIAIMNLESAPSGLDELIRHIVKSVLEDKQVIGLEFDAYAGNVKQTVITEERIVECERMGHKLLRCSAPLETDKVTKVLQEFDAAIVIGGKQTFQLYHDVKARLDTKLLYIPVSIHNNLPGSDRSLGFDTALNAIVKNVLQVKDTVESLLYPQPRLFGVRVPGMSDSSLVERAAEAVGADVFRHDFDLKAVSRLNDSLARKFSNGTTFSMLLFNEGVDPDTIAHEMTPRLNISWKSIEIDESQCMGPHPSAADRVLATELANEVIAWTKRLLDTGELIVNEHNVMFVRDRGAQKQSFFAY